MPVDWRWRRASFLASEPTACRHEPDDDWVRSAVDFLGARSRCHTESDQRSLAHTMPSLWQAHAAFTAQPPFVKWAVEAYILAKEALPEIARKCGLIPDAVIAYERVFFAVAERLECTFWIVSQAIGEKVFTGLTERDLGLVWKLLGYNHGPVLLDSLLHNVLHRDRPDNPEQAEQCIAREMQSLLQRHAALASLFLPVTQKTALKILRLHDQQRVREEEDELAKSQNGSIANHVVLAQVVAAVEAVGCPSASSSANHAFRYRRHLGTAAAPASSGDGRAPGSPASTADDGANGSKWWNAGICPAARIAACGRSASGTWRPGAANASGGQ